MSVRMYGLMVGFVDAMPDEESRSRCASAVRVREHALRSLENGDLEVAINLAYKAITLVPDFPKSQPLKGLCYAVKAMALLRSQRYAESVTAGSAALARLEGHPPLLNELATALNVHGCALLATRDTSASIACLERAIGIWRSIPGSKGKISDCADNLHLAQKFAAADADPSYAKVRKSIWDSPMVPRIIVGALGLLAYGVAFWADGGDYSVLRSLIGGVPEFSLRAAIAIVLYGAALACLGACFTRW